MKLFSVHWKSSKDPRKQRKYLANAPLHLRHKFLSANLSKDLRKKYHTRNLPIRKGDKVKVMSGTFKPRTGTVESVDLRNIRVFVEGIQQARKDGTKSNVPLYPSTLQLIELNLDDRQRKRKLDLQAKTPTERPERLK